MSDGDSAAKTGVKIMRTFQVDEFAPLIRVGLGLKIGLKCKQYRRARRSYYVSNSAQFHICNCLEGTDGGA